MSEHRTGYASKSNGNVMIDQVRRRPVVPLNCCPVICGTIWLKTGKLHFDQHCQTQQSSSAIGIIQLLEKREGKLTSCYFPTKDFPARYQKRSLFQAFLGSVKHRCKTLKPNPPTCMVSFL